MARRPSRTRRPENRSHDRWGDRAAFASPTPDIALDPLESRRRLNSGAAHPVRRPAAPYRQVRLAAGVLWQPLFVGSSGIGGHGPAAGDIHWPDARFRSCRRATVPENDIPATGSARLSSAPALQAFAVPAPCEQTGAPEGVPHAPPSPHAPRGNRHDLPRPFRPHRPGGVNDRLQAAREQARQGRSRPARAEHG